MLNKLLRASILISLFFYGCSELLNFEPVIPAWESVYSFKLTSEKIILGEAIESGEIDKVICSDSELCDSLRGKIFLFTQTEIIEPTLVGDQLSMDDIHKSFTQNVDDVNIDPITTNLGTEIGVIDLGAMEPVDTPPFNFSDIMPNSVYSDCEDAVSAGIDIPLIPSVDIVPDTNLFAFEDFQEANIQNAVIKLEIFNDMFIHIGNPITIELQDIDFNIIDETTFIDSIPPGESDSAFINLSNQTLPGTINVIVSGTSLGSNGAQVLNEEIDLESSFRVSISVQEMTVTSATAEIPSQQIANNSEMQLDQGGDEDEKVIISNAVVKEGQLVIDIINSIPLGSTLILTVPNLTHVENNVTLPLYEEIILGAGGISTNPPIGLSGYTLTMDPDSQKIEYSYDIITANTTPDMVTIDQFDSVNVNMILSGLDGISGITFSEITGIFQKSISTSDEISMDSGTKLHTAEIDSGSIIIDIENNLNLEAGVVFSLKEFLNGTDTLVQEFELTAGENTNSIIDLSGYTITFDEESVQSEAGQVIHYTSDVTMGEEEMTLNLEDSLVINVDIKNLSFKSISGILDTISVDDSMSIALPEYPVETTQLEGLGLAKATITIEMISGITVPVEIDLNLKGVNSETGNSISIPNYFPLNINGDTTRVVLENTEDLINIFPDTIFADIHAVIGGGDNIGQVSQADSIQGMVYVEVPLAFEVQDSVILELDPDSLGIVFDDTTFSNNILEVVVEVLVKNSLDLSIELTALVDQDTLFENPDTLIDGFKITGGFTDTNQIKLDEYFIDLFTEETYIKNIVTIFGQSDTSGNVLPSVLYTTDSLSLDIKGTLKILIDSTLINSEEE